MREKARNDCPPLVWELQDLQAVNRVTGSTMTLREWRELGLIERAEMVEGALTLALLQSGG